MQYIIVALCQCTTQACCWYNVFRCCGCIEDRPHVEIERQAEPTVVVAPKPSDNPFLNTGLAKEPYHMPAYKL